MTTDPKLTEIEAELAATRAELAATVDELSTRLDPRVQASNAVETGKRLWRDALGTDPEADPANRNRARAIVGGAAAALALLVAGVVRR
jgi:hypothetical protein